MQGWTATVKHGITRKRSKKILKHTGNLFKGCVHYILASLFFMSKREQ